MAVYLSKMADTMVGTTLFCLKTQDHYSISKFVFFQNGLLPVFSSFDIMWISCPIASTAHIL